MSSRWREHGVRQRASSSWRWGTMIPSMRSRDESRQELEGSVVACWDNETGLSCLVQVVVCWAQFEAGGEVRSGG